jgi:serine phosphatase RsbU (regulator of sigma subunit)/predicted enzyme related to lactoylglutathione lyase
MARMAGSPSRLWTHPSGPRLDRQDPYLRLQHVTVFVRDHDRSLHFYVDQLGFSLVADHRFESGGRWVGVSPPDGTAILALVVPGPTSKDYELIGRAPVTVFVTEDVQSKFDEWSRRGVTFLHPPQIPAWGGIFTEFKDADGNLFALIGFDEVTRDIEAQRRALADKLEAERRAEQELAIAKQVQARLFPQLLPPLATLDYAGTCIQARHVGGDYYDFLDLGHERVALVVADISGKGIAAALLMANLQANLRSQSALAADQPERLLCSVNQLFYDNTADISYATLFFADYDDKSRRLRYTNCGHLSAIVLRASGNIDRLESTGTVVGLFKHWECSTRQLQLFPGDTLALYTDGITESFNEAEEEFGEFRLIEGLRRHRAKDSPGLLSAVLEEVQRFSGDEQHDDITLIVAKCRKGPTSSSDRHSIVSQ